MGFQGLLIEIGVCVANLAGLSVLGVLHFTSPTSGTVVSVATTAASVGLKLTDNFLIWLKDIRDDIAAKKIPAAPASALATAMLTAELTKAEAAPAPTGITP